MKFIIVIFTMLVVILGANFYIFFRLWHLIPPFPASRILLVFLGILLAVLPFLSMGLGPNFPYWVSSMMYRIGCSWLIMTLYLAALFFFLDLIRIIGVLPLHRIMFHSWVGFGALSLVMAVLMGGANIRYHNKKRVEFTIKTEKRMGAGKPLKVVAIADLHLGYGVGIKEFRKWINIVNQEVPDLVLIAGDAFDNRLDPAVERNFAALFGEFKSKYGVYFVLGNHEYIANISEDIDFLNSAGVTVLKDDVALVGDSFWVAGRDDRSNPERKTVAQLTDSLDKSKPIILIEHQPYHLEEVEAAGVDLYFAGHTHDGQVFPVSWITKAMYELSHGYLQKGSSHFYVTSGIGLWGGKFRIGTQSEYVVINME